MEEHDHHLGPHWRRALWLAAGFLSLLAGLIGLLLPLLPTVPFVLLAAFCFSRGSRRCERWIVEHPRFGPMVVEWREKRAVPLRAKQLATVMMAISSIGALFLVPQPWGSAPGIVCTLVAVWLWSLPTAEPPASRVRETTPQGGPRPPSERPGGGRG